MELNSIPSKEPSRIPRKAERPYISSLKSSSMDTRRRPLRTYGKRASSTESSEPTPKRQCIPGPPAIASIHGDQTRLTPPDPEDTTKASVSRPSPSLPPAKKGTITAYFERISPQLSVVGPSSDPFSDPLSESSGPAITPPSSPPIITTTKRRVRRLKTRVVAQRVDGHGAGDDEREDEEEKARTGRIHDAGPWEGAPPPALSETESDVPNETGSVPGPQPIGDGSKPREGEKKRRTRPKKTASVQTTLSLSLSEAQYMECKECGMLYNHLHQTDVRYHARRHAALRRAKAQSCY